MTEISHLSIRGCLAPPLMPLVASLLVAHLTTGKPEPWPFPFPSP